jgi:hypothetical protein
VPGYFSVGGSPGPGRPYGVFHPAVVPADLVPQHVVVVGGERNVIDSVAPVSAADGPAPVEPSPVASSSEVPTGPTLPVPLGRLVGARSGDKGGNANVGVFARSRPAYAWLDYFLTEDRIRELLPETAGLRIDRYRLPKIWSLNFVVHQLLEEGVAASTRQDGQAKSLGEWLRARVVDVPAELLV